MLIWFYRTRTRFLKTHFSWLCPLAWMNVYNVSRNMLCLFSSYSSYIFQKYSFSVACRIMGKKESFTWFSSRGLNHQFKSNESLISLDDLSKSAPIPKIPIHFELSHISIQYWFLSAGNTFIPLLDWRG